MTAIQLDLTEIKRDWIEDAANVVRAKLPELGEFTTDDLHLILSEPESHSWYGALMAKLVTERHIEECGRKMSKRPEANGRKINLWKRRTLSQ